MSDPINIDGINSVGPIRTGYRDSFPDMPAFGTEYDQDRMSLPFDSSGSFQSDQDIFNILASAYPNESAEQIANRLGSLTANTAMSRQFGGAALDPYSQLAPTTTPPLVTTPPAPTGESLFGGILGGAKDATKAVAGVIDSGLQILGDIFGMGDPSLVVLNPTNPNATVVYGTPTGNATPTIIGTMPKSGAPVGVITGIPAMDEILAGIFNQRGQGGKSTEEIIRSVILGKIGTETGYPLEGVAGAIEGGLTGNFEDVVNSVNKVVLQIDKKLENEVGVNPYSVIPKANVGEVDPDGPQNVKTTPYDMVATPAGTFNPKDVGPIKNDSYSITKTDFPPVDPSAGVIDLLPTKAPFVDTRVIKGPQVYPEGDMRKTPPPLTPADLGEGTAVVANPPIVVGPPLPPKTTVITPPATPTSSQGMRMESTEKAGLADINSTFDLDSTFVENLMRALSGKDSTESEGSYYSGGKVAPYANIDEIIRLLRG